MKFEVRKLEGGIGAEILGLDLDRAVDVETAEALRQVWLDSAILLFRGVGTSNERHLRLSRVFGDLEVHPVESIRLAENDEIIRLAQKGDDKQMTFVFDGVPIAGRIPFHTDMIYTPTPNRGAVLRMIERPESGGETAWIDTAAAYDALPEATKRRIEGVEARFDFVSDLREMRFGVSETVEASDFGTFDYPKFPEVAHPLVWTHPISGRKSLSLSTIHLIEVLGMDRAEGDALLEELVNHTLCGNYTYVHDWEVGDMVLWDNWRTMHKAYGAPPDCVRVVHRTTIRGEVAMGRLL